MSLVFRIAAFCSYRRSSATRFLSVPIFGTLISTTSPDRKYFGGSNRAPAPVGVPVAMTSPVFNGMNVER